MQIVTAFPKVKSWNSVSGKNQQYGFKDEFTPTNNLFAKKVKYHWLTLMVLFLVARLTHTITHSFIHALFTIYTKFYNATTCCWLQLDFLLPRLPKWTSQETLRLYTKRPFK